ncbi:MAG: serine hydrolase [Acidobacteriota bacterium]
MPLSPRLVSSLVVCLIVWFAAAASAEPPALSSFEGRWEGAIAVPTGALEIDLDFEALDDGLRGDISIPVQGLRDLELTEVELTSERLLFAIPGIPGDPRFSGVLSADGSTLAGDFTQGGALLAFSVERSAPPADAVAASLDDLDAVIDRALADFQVPGLGLAIVRDGDVVFAEGFGRRDVENDLPMTADTLFAIGSTTKAMTATVLAMQAEDGLLDWDEPVVRSMPSFRLADPLVTPRISARDLVTHRSGMPRHDALWYGLDDGSRAEMIERLAHLELTADLRETFQYNNLMFLVAGYLSGRLDEATWEDAMRRRLFEPLGMERTNFSVDVSQTDADHALPYGLDDESDALERIPFRNIDLVGPAGSVNSSVREMAAWLLFNLAGGEHDGDRLIERANLHELHLPQMSLPSAPPPSARVTQSAYGMGWGVEVYRGHRRVGHGGGIDGFTTSVMFFPDDDLGLVSFTNRPSGLPKLLNQLAADRILGLEPVDWLSEGLREMTAAEEAGEAGAERLETTRVEGTEPAHELSAYAGTYRDAGYGDLTVTVDGERLRVGFNDMSAPFEHWHYEVWRGLDDGDEAALEGTRLQFRRDFDGHVAEAVVPMEMTASPIVFTRQADPRWSDPEILARYVGAYVGETGQRGEIRLVGDRLTVHLPGQPVYTLVPQASGRLAIEGLEGFSLVFEEDEEGRVTAAHFHQPNGIFTSRRIDE